MLRRAEITQASVRLVGETFRQCCRQSRLAYASLTGEQDHLAFASLCLRPAPKQQFEFFLPSDERGQARRVQRLKAAFDQSFFKPDTPSISVLRFVTQSTT
jgi:hypothetical protein